MFTGFSATEISEDKTLFGKYKMLGQLLKQSPFTATGLTQEQEHELLSDASDEISVSSEEPPEPLPPPISIDSSTSFPRRSPDLSMNLTVCKTSWSSLELDSGVSTGTASQPPAPSSTACPKFKVIPGTTFAVDALGYNLTDLTHHFLTHFREGQRIIGDLTGQTLIMTRKTADRMRAKVRLQERNLRLVELNKPIEIKGVRVTALDANHSGSVMFLFQNPSGLNTLYVGDQARPSHAMEEERCFWNVDVHILYINTSYLSSKFSFQDQWPAVSDICALARANYPPTQRMLLVCGANISQSNLVLKKLAEEFNFRIWTQPGALKVGQLPRKHRADDRDTANIHVLNVLNYDNLLPYLDDHTTAYGVVLAVRPNAASNRRDLAAEKSPECDGMRRFVRFLQPLEIVSTGDTHLRCNTAMESVGWPAVAFSGTYSVTAFVRRIGGCCTFCDRLNREGGL